MKSQNRESNESNVYLGELLGRGKVVEALTLIKKHAAHKPGHAVNSRHRNKSGTRVFRDRERPRLDFDAAFDAVKGREYLSLKDKIELSIALRTGGLDAKAFCDWFSAENKTNQEGFRNACIELCVEKPDMAESIKDMALDNGMVILNEDSSRPPVPKKAPPPRTAQISTSSVSATPSSEKGLSANGGDKAGGGIESSSDSAPRSSEEVPLARQSRHSHVFQFGGKRVNRRDKGKGSAVIRRKGTINGSRPMFVEVVEGKDERRLSKSAPSVGGDEKKGAGDELVKSASAPSNPSSAVDVLTNEGPFSPRVAKQQRQKESFGKKERGSTSFVDFAVGKESPTQKGGDKQR